VDDPAEKTAILAMSKVVQNNARPAHAQQNADSLARIRLKVMHQADIQIPAHMHSISQKGPLMRRILEAFNGGFLSDSKILASSTRRMRGPFREMEYMCAGILISYAIWLCRFSHGFQMMLEFDLDTGRTRDLT
jgi:hypothetical protein